MEIIDAHTKGIMEECKSRARAKGLDDGGESLEFIVTNQDMIKLSPKIMIPTLYDYWANDVAVIQGQKRFEVFPSNPYETVINTRPSISFYNDNNPDWVNVFIFYHVIGHIDFFRNNYLFTNTWDDDFKAQALAHKRTIANLRLKHGRWLDYVIEFSRGIDNLAGFHQEISQAQDFRKNYQQNRINFYFDQFLQNIEKVHITDYNREIERYNQTIRKARESNQEQSLAETLFFAEVKSKHPEFESKFKKFKRKKTSKPKDLMEFLLSHSPKLDRKENGWMKSVMEIVRTTSLYFQPQIRTKIINEGWASYWHQNLFLEDDRIRGHEVDFAKIDAGVTSLQRAGLNPYAIGLRLIQYAEELADKGKLGHDFELIRDIYDRRNFDKKTKKGNEFIFHLRKNYSDFQLINEFVDQDFVDKHNLFVAGKRINFEKDTWEYYIKSRKAEDYKQMLLDSLYHPPKIIIDEEKSKEGSLYLKHIYEGKPLEASYIPHTMIGIEYIWGGPVKLETIEWFKEQQFEQHTERKVIYEVRDRKVDKLFVQE
jgi:stage V sporulation protein R